MKKLLSFGVMALVLTAASFAQVFDFTVTNDTGYTIDNVYVAPTVDDSWGDDVLGQDQLADGEYVEIKFSAVYEALLLAFKVDLYDLKVVYSDGSEDEFNDLKLEEINELTLSLDKKGNGLATWK